MLKLFGGVFELFYKQINKSKKKMHIVCNVNVAPYFGCETGTYP